jgi:hypothetical protein
MKWITRFVESYVIYLNQFHSPSYSGKEQSA